MAIIVNLSIILIIVRTMIDVRVRKFISFNFKYNILFMPSIFTVSNILYIISSKDSLYMSESLLRPEISYTNSSIEICFYLKNGKVTIDVGSQEHSFFNYIDDNEVVLTMAQFTNEIITDTNGSFHKAFRQIISFDRECSSQSKSTDTSIDRASFGLAEVN